MQVSPRRASKSRTGLVKQAQTALSKRMVPPLRNAASRQHAELGTGTTCRGRQADGEVRQARVVASLPMSKPCAPGWGQFRGSGPLIATLRGKPRQLGIGWGMLLKG